MDEENNQPAASSAKEKHETFNLHLVGIAVVAAMPCGSVGRAMSQGVGQFSIGQ